jgi:hypothetical protein
VSFLGPPKAVYFGAATEGWSFGMNLLAIVTDNPQTHTVQVKPMVNGVELVGCSFEVKESLRE